MCSKPRLGDLPVETIVSILRYCDYRTVLRFSATSKEYHRTICNSPSLQLRIELECNGLKFLKNQGASSDEAILKELRGSLLVQRSLRYWKSPSYQPRWEWGLDIEIHHYTMRDGLYIGAYARVEEPADLGVPCDSLTIMHLGGKHDRPQFLEFETRFSTFDVDPTQELVVLIEALDITPTRAQVHFRSFASAEPHPLARFATITVQLGNSEPELDDRVVPHIVTQVADNLLVIECTWLYLSTEWDLYEVLIFDWIAGALLGRIYSKNKIAPSVALLDTQHLAFYSATSESQSQHLDTLALLIYQVPCTALSTGDATGQFETAPHASLTPDLILKFPRIVDSLTVDKISSIDVAVGVGRVAISGSTTFVCSRVPILDVHVLLSDPKRDDSDLETEAEAETKTINLPNYHVYISTAHIFELLDRKEPGKVTIPWNEWGARATRWFDGTRPRSSVAGSQCLQWDLIARRHRLSSIEFNPHSIEQYFIPFPATSNTFLGTEPQCRRPIHEYSPLSVTQGVVGSNENVEVRASVEMFGTDSKSVFHDGFEEPVESFLPYRVTTSKNLLPDCSSWHLQGHRLMGVHDPKIGGVVSDDSKLPSFLVYHLH